MVVFSVRLLALNVYWELSLSQISNRTHIYDSSRKRLKKISIACTALEIIPCSIFSRVSSDQKYSIVAMPGLELFNRDFLALIEYKNVHVTLWAMTYIFQPVTDETLQTYRYFHGKYSVKLHTLVPSFQIFTTKANLFTYTVSN